MASAALLIYTLLFFSSCTLACSSIIKSIYQPSKRIDALANEVEEYEIIQTIPGIGEKIAATIISEVGEIDRFNHPKKLVAFVGVNPSVHISGKFTATINRITKRGSSRLKHALYMAVLCGLRRTGSKKLKAFYAKKITEGKKPFLN
jgi:transposase